MKGKNGALVVQPIETATLHRIMFSNKFAFAAGSRLDANVLTMLVVANSTLSVPTGLGPQISALPSATKQKNAILFHE